MFSFESINVYHTQLRDGSTSCVQAVDFYLDQIKKHSHLNAFVRVYDQEAINKAVSLDKSRSSGKPMGKLHGVVVAIKDVICYKEEIQF